MTGAGPAPPERESYTGERRVTVDLDTARPFDVVRAWTVLESAGAYDLKARVSSGREGFHVRAWFDADDADERSVERLRLAAGDHTRRVDMDRRHTIKPPQVLFEGAAPWRSDPWRAADDLMRLSRRHDRDDPRSPRVTGWFDAD